MLAARGASVLHLPQPLPHKANQKTQGHAKENNHEEWNLHLYVETDQLSESFRQKR